MSPTVQTNYGRQNVPAQDRERLENETFSVVARLMSRPKGRQLMTGIHDRAAAQPVTFEMRNTPQLLGQGLPPVPVVSPNARPLRPGCLGPPALAQGQEADPGARRRARQRRPGEPRPRAPRRRLLRLRRRRAAGSFPDLRGVGARARPSCRVPDYADGSLERQRGIENGPAPLRHNQSDSRYATCLVKRHSSRQGRPRSSASLPVGTSRSSPWTRPCPRFCGQSSPSQPSLCTEVFLKLGTSYQNLGEARRR
jgi:hypothetical protein